MRTRISLVALVVTAGALAGGTARADDTAVTRADALFREGQKLLDTDHVAEACDRLTESQRLDPKLGRLLNLAFCHERANKTASAWAEYDRAAAWALQHDANKKRADFARAHAEELQKRLSLVTLHVADTAPETTIEIDGERLAHDRWLVPQPLDPGAHTIVARAPGRASRTLSITVATGPATQTVEIAALAPTATATATATATPTPTSTPTPTPTSTPTPTPTSTPNAGGGARGVVGLLALGTGVAAIGVGTYFGVRTLHDKSQADASCSTLGGATRCDAAGMSALDDAHTSATVSTIAFAAGAVGSAVGAYLLLTSHGKEPAHTTALRISPNAGGARASLEATW